MKKFYFFCLVSGVFIFLKAQVWSEAEMKSFIDAEALAKQNLVNYNVNPNTLNYDLRFQQLELSINPENTFVSGKVISHFIPNQSLSSLYFDFTDQLTVSDVKYHDQSLNFSQLSSKELKIDFPQTLTAGVLDSLMVSYSGVPSTDNRGLYFTKVEEKPVAFSLAEPYGAREWFPTKQSLNDKIEKLNLKILSPKLYDVAGNGRLVSVDDVGTDQHLSFWQTNYPIPAYLVAVGIAEYKKHFDVISDPPFPFVNYYYPSSDANQYVHDNVAWTKVVMPFYEQYFGAYPYRNEKYGHMEMALAGAGMEHATMSSMGVWNSSAIAHELVHQWFGDKVTCGAWNDIWLNEGFAIFGTNWALEKLVLSPQDFKNHLQTSIDYITAQPGGSVYVPDADLGNVGRVFDGRLTYQKGGYVLRMLKWILGDEAFFSAVRDYLSRTDLAYSYAKTQDFKSSVEQSTAQDLDYFFNDWIYGEGFPSYQIKWNQSGNQLILKVNQTQSSSSVNFYKLPLPIKLIGTHGEVLNLKLDHTYDGQVFQKDINFSVASVVFNDELQILEKNSTLSFDSNLASDNFWVPTVQIYPNPVEGLLNFVGLKKTQKYKILDASGRIVLSGKVDKSIRLEGLPLGNYLLVLESQTFKFIKK